MKNLGKIGAELRRRNRKQYTLLSACLFFSVLLITAYVSIMRSPTVLDILPEGGDSRKMVMMIFALAAVGCGVFSIYSASLFFRYKSREAGIFLMLGASRGRISKQLFKEVMLTATGSCLAGALLGTPLAWCIWQLFRAFLVDTQEMKLSFDPQAYLIALAFTAGILVALFLMGRAFIRRTNLIDIVNQQHKSEPVHDVKPWFGPLGIVLMAAGGFAGYLAPTIMVRMLDTYQTGWTKLFYLPFFVGLYMVLIHTVVHGWRQGKSRYRNIASRSMMKFQGRQTVNNMLVLTVLIAGAYFATFNTPMMGTAQIMEMENRPVDYAFHYRADQNLPSRSEIEAMAAKDKVAVTGWKDAETAVLGSDGREEVSDGGGKFHFEYRKLGGECNCISESEYREMTGKAADVQPGRFAAVMSEESAGKMDSDDKTLLTNMTTRKSMSFGFQRSLRFGMMASPSYYVLDDADYAKITAGLAEEWCERLVCFNVKDELQTYDFAKELFHEIVNRSGPECEVDEDYDRVAKIAANEAGKTWWGDEHPEIMKVSYDQPDSSQFRIGWKYMPKFRVLDRNDMVREYAVYFMVFLFISIICFAAVLLIGYTRCVTIAVNNRRVYDDLRHLGAAPGYLFRSVRGQVSKTFGAPGLIGTVLIFAYFVMILFMNDSQITREEFSALAVCAGIALGLSIVLWAFYRFTLRRVCRMLKIN